MPGAGRDQDFERATATPFQRQHKFEIVVSVAADNDEGLYIFLPLAGFIPGKAPGRAATIVTNVVFQLSPFGGDFRGIVVNSDLQIEFSCRPARVWNGIFCN